MNQVPTWIDMMVYTLLPVAVATLLTFGVLFAAHERGMKFAGMRLREHSRYAKFSAAVLLLIAIVLAVGAIDTWTVVRYFGGWNLPVEATAWRDSVFGLPLGFYLFDLPFYALLRGFVLVLAVAAGVVYWLTARGWQLRDRIAELQEGGQLNISILGLQGALKSGFLRGASRRISAGVRVPLFPGPVRDGLERPQLHGWSGLCGPEDYPAFAVAGDRRLHHGGYVCHRRPLETSCVDGAGARYPGCVARQRSERFMCGPTRSRSNVPTFRNTSRRRAARSAWIGA